MRAPGAAAGASRAGLASLALAALALGPQACSRPKSLVVPLAPQLVESEPGGGAKLRGDGGLAHDRVEARAVFRRGKMDERQKLVDVQAAHARLAVLDAQIEQEKARAR